jgi:hypothetical protein
MGLSNPALLQIPQPPWVLAHSSGIRMTLHMYGDPVTDMENVNINLEQRGSQRLAK